MAQVVDERPERSSWFRDEWFDGQPWLLKKGDDFDITLDAARRQIQRRAQQKKVKVDVQVDPDEEAIYVKADHRR